MKRTLALLTSILLTLTLFACGNNSNDDNNNNNKQTEETQNQHDESNSETSANKNVLRESYEPFDLMKDAFDDLVLEESKDHEIMSVSISSVSPSEIKTLTYMLPLSLVGTSITNTGEFDKDLEIIGLNAAWLDDVDINYDGSGNYQLSGTDKKGNKIDVKIMHDSDTDSTRLEAHNNEALALVFEYVKTDKGYAAQYYYEDTTGSENYQPVVEFCNYMIVFDGENGTYARFNGVETEPTSIYGNAPDTSTITDGATSWFTLTDGQFTGNIDGQEF